MRGNFLDLFKYQDGRAISEKLLEICANVCGLLEAISKKGALAKMLPL